MQNFILIIIVLIVGAFVFKDYQKQKAKTSSEQSMTDLMSGILALKAQREATKRTEIAGQATAKDWINLGSNALGAIVAVAGGGPLGGAISGAGGRVAGAV